MDELQGPQYAVQIAVHTLRDRCKALQQHVTLLEEENVKLKIQCSHNEESKRSLNELDYLRAQVAELLEQKDHLQNKVKMVTNENQELWSKLSKLTRVNKSLGSQLHKINDTLTQHTSCGANAPNPQSNLIRSKTFTKSELQTKILQKNLEENDKISLELEDISLKLSDSFTKQKRELDQLCCEISEMTFANEEFTDNCGFMYDEELENDIMVEVQQFADDLLQLKEAVLHQQIVLELNLKNVQQLKGKLKCRNCLMTEAKIEKCTSTSDLSQKSFDNKCTETDTVSDRFFQNSSPTRRQNNADCSSNNDMICPFCSKMFQKDFSLFQRHVEEHFLPEDYEVL